MYYFTLHVLFYSTCIVLLYMYCFTLHVLFCSTCIILLHTNNFTHHLFHLILLSFAMCLQAISSDSYLGGSWCYKAAG